MNDLSLALHRRVDLAVEPPFQLGALLITPASLEVRCRASTETLEPRVMQVLVALHRARGQAVSREELIELCWDGRIVGEDSLNRSISQLRKGLASDPSVAINTIPKVGYQLRADGLHSIEDHAAAPTEVSAGPTKRVLLLGALGAGLVAAVVGAVLLTRPAELSAGDVRPLTREVGVETHPALSPDGQRLAYAAGAGFGAPRDIFMRAIQLGDAEPTRLTATPSDEYAPAWSRGGERLAFARLGRDGACQIVVISPPNGAERIAGRCSSPPDSLAWRGGDELIYADRPKPRAPRQLYALSIVSGAVRPLTSPPGQTLGDAAPAVSADGRRLAFRRTAALGGDDLYLLDLQTGRERRLTSDGWKATGAAWRDDGRTLIFSSNRGGDFGLWSLDVGQDAGPRRVTPGLLPLGRLSMAGDTVAAEMGRFRAVTSRMSAGGALSPMSPAGGMEWDPDVAPGGSLVFGSDRSGTNEVWAQRQGSSPVRLTDLKASYVHSPRWSPDGRQVAFIAVVGGRTDIFRMNADGSHRIRLTGDGAAKGRVAWTSTPDQLVYTVKGPGGWRMERLDGRTLKVGPLAGTEGVVVVQNWNGRLYARGIDDDRLLGFDDATGALSELRPGLSVSDVENWAPGLAGVYEVRQGAGEAEVWLKPWAGEPRPVGRFKATSRANVAVGPGGEVFVSQMVADDIDLVLIDLQRR